MVKPVIVVVVAGDKDSAVVTFTNVPALAAGATPLAEDNAGVVPVGAHITTYPACVAPLPGKVAAPQLAVS